MVDQEKTWTEIAGHLPGYALQSLKEIFKEEILGSGIESQVSGVPLVCIFLFFYFFYERINYKYRLAHGQEQGWFSSTKDAVD